MTQEGRKRERAILERRLFEQRAQSRGDAAGHESIVIAPEIDPGGGVERDLVDEIFADREAAFAETFFADGIGGGIEKPT